MKPRYYIQLGRIGDILNVLPLCWRDFSTTGQRPYLMIATSFRSILEGVSYVVPVLWHGQFEAIVPAWSEAVAHAARVGAADPICTQIYGTGLSTDESCSSFMRESWERVPGAPAWGLLPLIFDQRDPDREAAVISHLRKGRTQPYVVVALSGTSSPFPEAASVRRLLGELRPHFDIVEISAFLAPRFFDLLGLLEGAHCLVAVDSAPLHLAAAVPQLPVVAFITREPTAWHGSPWRRQHVARYYYDEAPDPSDVLFHVRHARELRALRAPTIWHAWTHQADLPADTLRRVKLARQTWQGEYLTGLWQGVEFCDQHAARHSGNAPLNDPRPMPFVHDLIDRVMDQQPDIDDVIALTNADVCFTPGLTGWVMDTVAHHGCAFTHRYDFAHLDRPLHSEAGVRRGTWYPGSDAFFFSVRWWQEHRAEYPDMILGREQCDEVLRQLIKRHGGLEIPAAIYHEKHASFWEQPGEREGNPGNRHNRLLARAWFRRMGYGPNDPWWWKLPVR